jgi:uncharacterized membrane protein YkvA (DUF1232 family)
MGARSRWTAVSTLVRAVRGTLRPGEPGVGARLRALPRLVVATLAGRYHGTTPSRLGLMALAAVYIVSPLDVLPDVLPLIGVADDAVVLAWLAGAILTDAGDFLAWERVGRDSPRGARRGRRPFDHGRPDVVPGSVVR